MAVGILTLSIFMAGSNSLKRKRSILKSLENSLIHKFNVCVAEVDFHDKWQRSTLALGFINNDKKNIDVKFSKIIKYMEALIDCELIDFQQELI